MIVLRKWTTTFAEKEDDRLTPVSALQTLIIPVYDLLSRTAKVQKSYCPYNTELFPAGLRACLLLLAIVSLHTNARP